MIDEILVALREYITYFILFIFHEFVHKVHMKNKKKNNTTKEKTKEAHATQQSPDLKNTLTYHCN